MMRPFELIAGFAFVPAVNVNAGTAGVRNGCTTAIVESTTTAAALRLAGASRGSDALPSTVIATMGGVWRWWARAAGTRASEAMRSGASSERRTAEPYHAGRAAGHSK